MRPLEAVSYGGSFVLAPPLRVWCVPIRASVPDLGVTAAPERSHSNLLLPPSGRAPRERHTDTHLLWYPGGLQG